MAGLPGRIGRTVLPAIDKSIDLREAVPVGRQGVAVPGLDDLGSGLVERAARTPRDPSTPVAAIVSRNTVACSIPIEAPRPTDGLEHAQASPAATTPVATGVPSTMRFLCRSSIPAMAVTLSSIGSPSSQCATSGRDRTVRSQTSASCKTRSALSLALVTSVTLHVPLSAGSVREETVPRCWRKPPSAGGTSPLAERKWRP